MLINTISLFLLTSLFLYLLLGGADFGAGMLEGLLGKKRPEEKRQLVSKAIGPVWETNHIWLILAIVILFNGFPKAFFHLSLSLHIPLLVLLIGIILRGCAFAFRQYDAIQDRTQKIYSVLFQTASFITPLAMGVIAGGVILGKINLDGSNDYISTYINPWFHWLPFAIGCFVVVLCIYIASVYLWSEVKDAEFQNQCRAWIKRSGGLAVFFGIAVFLVATLYSIPLLVLFAHNKASVFCMLFATFLFIPLRFAIRNRSVWAARLLVSAQIFAIFLGWVLIQFPILIQMHPHSLTLQQAAAPEPTLRFLTYSLLGGSALIFPALFYLFRIFKSSN